MKTVLKRNSRLFPYYLTFGSTTDFLLNLSVDAGFLDIQPYGNVACVLYTADKVKSGETGKRYDHVWLETQAHQAGKMGVSGMAPQDGFSIACKGQKVVPTGEIETSPAYFQTDLGTMDFFSNVKSAMQLEFNKGKKRPMGAGTHWYSEWQGQTLLPMGKTPISDHEWVICGWDEAHPDMFKIDAHLGYYQYIPKDVFNSAMDATYGSVALTLAETTQEVIEFNKAVKISIITKLIDFWYNLGKLLFPNYKFTVPPVPVPQPVVPEVVTPAPKKDLINDFCLAIRDYEGKPGDLNYINNNPGNIRDKKGKFLKFTTYDAGFAYLTDYVRRACTGKHDAYKPNYTFYQFFATYAPTGDNNNPKIYAEAVCKKIGLLPSQKISELIT